MFDVIVVVVIIIIINFVANIISITIVIIIIILLEVYETGCQKTRIGFLVNKGQYCFDRRLLIGIVPTFYSNNLAHTGFVPKLTPTHTNGFSATGIALTPSLL